MDDLLGRLNDNQLRFAAEPSSRTNEKKLPVKIQTIGATLVALAVESPPA